MSSVIVKGLEQPQPRLPILCSWACDLFLFICCWFQLFAVRFIFLFFANIRPNHESHNSGCLSIAYFKSPQTTRLTVTGGGKRVLNTATLDRTLLVSLFPHLTHLASCLVHSFYPLADGDLFTFITHFETIMPVTNGRLRCVRPYTFSVTL